MAAERHREPGYRVIPTFLLVPLWRGRKERRGVCAFLAGVPRRGIYDDMRTAVDKVGRARSARPPRASLLWSAASYMRRSSAIRPPGARRGRSRRTSPPSALATRAELPPLAALNDWLPGALGADSVRLVSSSPKGRSSANTAVSLPASPTQKYDDRFRLAALSGGHSTQTGRTPQRRAVRRTPARLPNSAATHA